MNHSSDSTSTSLIQRVKLDDPEAWSRLARIYAPLIYEWARRAGLQQSDSADVVQDVFHAMVKDFQRFKQGKDSPRFRAWMWGITRHKIKDHFRTRKLQPNASGGTDANHQLHQLSDEEVDESFNSSEQTCTDTVALRALAILETDFHEKTWKAFWRVAIADQSPDQVAADLGISVASVYAAKSRVLARLRKELEDLV